MPNRFSPTVLPRAPSLSIFEDELAATRARPTTLQRLGGALKEFENVGRFFSERGIRRAITDEDQQDNEGFGAALGRAATASLDSRKAGTSVRGEPGLSTRLGSFDADSGRFLRPDDNVRTLPGTSRNIAGVDDFTTLPGVGTPGFNPEDLTPLIERAGLGASDAGIEDIPVDRSRADDQIRRHQRLFGDTDAMIEERERGRKLAQAISVLRQAGASQDEIGLLQAGVVKPETVLSRVDQRTKAELDETEQRQSFADLNRIDPVRYPEFLPGFDYNEEKAALEDDFRARQLEEFEQSQITGRTQMTEAGKDRRAADRRTTSRGTVSDQMKSNARGMIRGGASRQQVVDQLVRSGASLEDAFDVADDAVSDVTGKTKPSSATGATLTPAEHRQKANEFLAAGVDDINDPAFLATLSDPRLGLSAKDQDAIIDILEDL
jgi:hypothetical protein